MKNIITAFKEYKNFNQKKPWDINTMTFHNEVYTPPHYAETIEVLLCYNLKGSIYIGGEQLDFCGNQIFFVAPNVVHSMNYKKNDGYVNILKINVPQLNPIFNLSNYLKCYNLKMENLPICVDPFDEVHSIEESFDSNASFYNVLEAILLLFDKLISNSALNENSYVLSNNTNLYTIINWTETHFEEKITLEDAASVLGYEKHYFCNKFKSLTGITYLNYLNNLRITNACKHLKSGMSVLETCDISGFDDLSYFIQLFKKIVGVTPKKYWQQYNKREQ